MHSINVLLELNFFGLAFFKSFMWGICILQSFFGWGGFLFRLLNIDKINKLDLKIGLGISFYVILGGILNLFQLISHEFIFLLVITGIFLFLSNKKLKNFITKSLMKLYFQINSENIFNKVLFISILFYVLFLYSSNISISKFNIVDDYQHYFVIPNLMLDIGHDGNNPFDPTRVTSFGGQYFLDTLILSVLKENNLEIIDLGLGWVILFIYLFLKTNKKKYETRNKCFFLFLFFTIIAQLYFIPKATHGYVLIPSFLILSIFSFFKEKYLKNFTWNFNDYFIISILCSGLICLRNNLLPFTIFFLFINLLYFFGKKRYFDFFIVLLLIGMLKLIFISPWSISIYSTFKTFLYPILGEGLINENFNAFKPNIDIGNIFTLLLIGDWKVNIYIFHYVCFFTIIFLSFSLFKKNDQTKFFYLTYCFLIILNILIINYASGGGYGNLRYSFSINFSFLILIMHKGLMRPYFKNNYRKYFFTLISLCFVLLFLFFDIILNTLSYNFNNIKYGLRGNSKFHNIDYESANKYSRITDFILNSYEDEKYLAHVDYPFLLDFSNDNVYSSEYIGGSGLPPEFPSFVSSDSLATYLGKNSIRYIIFSYKTGANFSANYRSKVENILDFNLSYNKVNIIPLKHVFWFHDRVFELMKKCDVLYDDGYNVIIDLNTINKST